MLSGPSSWTSSAENLYRLIFKILKITIKPTINAQFPAVSLEYLEHKYPAIAYPKKFTCAFLLIFINPVPRNRRMNKSILLPIRIKIWFENSMNITSRVNKICNIYYVHMHIHMHMRKYKSWTVKSQEV